MKINKNKTAAFILIKLIVVITVLAILGTIDFMSLRGYSSKAYDGIKTSNIKNKESYKTITSSGGEELKNVGKTIVNKNSKINGDSKPLIPTFSCTNPNGLVVNHAIISNNSDLKTNIDYQNTNINKKCHYQCKPGFGGTNCEIEISTTEWGKQIEGKADYVDINDIAIDFSGNIYVTGQFSNTADFGTSTPLSSVENTDEYYVGNMDIFIAKYNSNGDCEWTKSAGGIGNDEGNGIAVDSFGNTYITGWYNSSSIDFGNNKKIETNAGDNDIFIAKYNTNGDCQRAKSAGGIASDKGWEIAVDSFGNAYITGLYRSSFIDFGNNIKIKPNAGESDIFIAKYNTNGDCEWTKGSGGTGDDIGYGITTDSFGNAYIIGDFQSFTIDFKNGQKINNTSTEEYSDDVFIAKYNASGDCQWAKSFDGSGGRDITVDSSGNIYITGYFKGSSIDFKNGQKISKDYPRFDDIFIAKYNASGDCQWAKSASGKGHYHGFGIAVDSFGNAYITGSLYNSNVEFGNNKKIKHTDNSDIIFIAKYNANGDCQWAKSAAGDGQDFGMGIVVDSSGNIYVGGSSSSDLITINGVDLINIGGDTNGLIWKTREGISLSLYSNFLNTESPLALFYYFVITLNKLVFMSI